MNSRQELASHWEAVFDQIDATMHTAPEEALKLCKQLFVESYLWEPPVYVRAAERYGKIMDHLGKSTEARDSLFAAQEAAQGSCLPIYEAKILERLARSYYTNGDYRRAIQFWNSCIDVVTRTDGDAETWILAKVGLAQAYKDGGDYGACDAMLEQARARTDEVGDPHLDAKVKINMAVSLIERDRLDEAAPLLQDAFTICTEHKLFDYLAESNLYLAKIALAQGALERARKYLDAGLAHARQVDFRWCEAHLLAAKAQLCSRTGELETALRTVKEAQAIAIADGF
jgi:tetratricopeptide (TPR) repeat protein